MTTKLRRLAAVKWIATAVITALSIAAHAQTQYRGFNLESPQFPDLDFRKIGQSWNANILRVQLVMGQEADNWDIPQYRAWIQERLSYLDAVLPICEAQGVKVIIDLHTPPGRFLSETGTYPQLKLFGDKTRNWQGAFIETWQTIANRYKGASAVYGYDLLNEPAVGKSVATGLKSWTQLAQVTAQAIRAIDSGHKVIIESEYGLPTRINLLHPIDFPGVVYSVHMYSPQNFTGQGLPGVPGRYSYPGVVDGLYWDATRLRSNLQAVRDFQLAHNNAKILMGEFSVSCFADPQSRANYLRDVMDICEGWGWDWTYHAYTPAAPWSLEVPTISNPAQDQIRQFLARNRKKYQVNLASTATALAPSDPSSDFRFVNWDGDSIPDLAFIKKANTGSGKLELHVLSGASNYQNFLLNRATSLPYFGANSEFFLYKVDGDSLYDLVLILKNGTGSGKVEMHILSGASNYQSFITNLAMNLTPANNLDQFELQDWDNDGYFDLTYFKKTATATGRTEVHVLSGRSGFQSFLLNIATLFPTQPNWKFAMKDLNGDGYSDLVGICPEGTVTPQTEVHALSGITGWQSNLLIRSSKLPQTSSSGWFFGFTNFNSDSNPDLGAVKYAGVSGRTEVHFYSGAGD